MENCGRQFDVCTDIKKLGKKALNSFSLVIKIIILTNEQFKEHAITQYHPSI